MKEIVPEFVSMNSQFTQIDEAGKSNKPAKKQLS
jgi:hypothetical protein